MTLVALSKQDHDRSMQNLVNLFQNLNRTIGDDAKVNALIVYFNTVSDTDKNWAIAILSHMRPARIMSYKLLAEWAVREANLPDWLLVESHRVVGDWAETIALLIPGHISNQLGRRSLTDHMNLILQLKTSNDEEKRQEVLNVWRTLKPDERLIFNKLISGGLRIAVEQNLMVRALAIYTGREAHSIAIRLVGKWNPTEVSFEELFLSDQEEDSLCKPYPVHLAHVLDMPVSELGDIQNWQVERKWDGIRGQIIIRKGIVYTWSGEDLVTDKYPEFQLLKDFLPSGTVVDGEILAYKKGQPLPFQLLEKRISCRRVTKKHLLKNPVSMIVFDLLEWEGRDLRQCPLDRRREFLEAMISKHDTQGILILSPQLLIDTWDALEVERKNARVHHCTGLMLKRRNSVYQGVLAGSWLKYNADPYQINAVLIYAQRGDGRRANVYTSFTFGVWHNKQLISFAKANSGLTTEEFEEITHWVRSNTVERFGPVSVVSPELVFELHCKGISGSTRHKSGIAVHGAYIHCWHRDKKPSDGDTLETLKRLLD